MIELPGRLLEFINGYLFIVCIGMALFFASYLWRKWRAGAEWTDVEIGIALLVYALGDAAIREPVWYYRHLLDNGETISPHQVDLFWFVASVGAALSILGGLCALRVATPYWMRPWPWIVTGIIAFAFAGISVWG